MRVQLLVLRHVCLFFFVFFFERISLDCLALMDIGGNVLQAASRTVSKDKENDPGTIIEVGKKKIFEFDNLFK